MSEKIFVPVLGESITEATVAKWLKNEGDMVEADEPIVELETDKVNLEVPSPINGTLQDIVAKDGDVVEVGALLAAVGENGTKEPKKVIEKVKPQAQQDNIINLESEKKQDTPKIFEDLKESTEDDDKGIEPLVLTKEVKDKDENKTLSPAVRKIVVENNLDTEKIKGTGKEGRILKSDLISMMGVNPKPSERKLKYGQEERIKMTRLRQTIAKRLKQAQENAALLTTFNEVDMIN